jgi:hypothetical protein
VLVIVVFSLVQPDSHQSSHPSISELTAIINEKGKSARANISRQLAPATRPPRPIHFSPETGGRN